MYNIVIRFFPFFYKHFKLNKLRSNSVIQTGICIVEFLHSTVYVSQACWKIIGQDGDERGQDYKPDRVI
jgi:hypothetical protein